jgi:two-component system, NtrC family, nitrogen regulation sensor histidine kinase NtrY
VSLRAKLVVVFLIATLAPMAALLWVTTQLLETSMQYATTAELDELSRSLESTGRELYQQVKDKLYRQRASGAEPAARFLPENRSGWPAEIAAFESSAQHERFLLQGPNGDRLQLLVRQPDGAIALYESPIGGSGMNRLSRQFSRARNLVDRANSLDVRRGLTLTLLAAAAGVYLLSLAILIAIAFRVSRPMRDLAQGLQRLASGDFSVRLSGEGADETGQAIVAFNDTARHLADSQDRVVHLTRVASWQTLARKMAHEVKNSLTPIRLTMEEIGARNGRVDPSFLKQASAIVADEVTTLERRVRAFSDFASEPAAAPCVCSAASLVEDRLALLRAAHPETRFESVIDNTVQFLADPDLMKGALHNLLENAAHAAGPEGIVRVRVAQQDSHAVIEVMDSGPGLTDLARSTLFEPTITFKKDGMGLGLSIARRGVVLCGGAIDHAPGPLGGACFRITLPAVAQPQGAPVVHA